MTRRNFRRLLPKGPLMTCPLLESPSCEFKYV